ncbi:MAG: hypothetical protein V4709_15855 [Pseudomonadota bacterium]
MTDTLHDDADDLLHWLNAHSVSISDGIPFSLMQQKWSASKRPYPQLRTSLEWLFGQGLVAMTPGLEPPHIRLSAKGFDQLLTAMDTGRTPAPPAAVVSPPVAANPVPAAAAPAPNRQVPLAQQIPSAASMAATAVADTLEPAMPRRFVEPSKQPTEIGLRNQILLIFRDLKLASGQQLIAMTLTRYWQEMGQRGEHLRAGIDILLRDGYVQMAVKRYENYWTLMPDGHAYLTGPLSHTALLGLAAPLQQIEQSYPDADLRRKVLGLFKNSASQYFAALESSWRHSRNSLIHALDLLVKSGDLELSEQGGLHFNLSTQAARRR